MIAGSPTGPGMTPISLCMVRAGNAGRHTSELQASIGHCRDAPDHLSRNSRGAKTMLRKRSAFYLSAAIAACALMLGIAPSTAGDPDELGSGPRFADDYEGYHLRPPYYLPDLGWHYPLKGNRNRALYFGYHFHEPAYPLTVYDTRKPVVVHQPNGRHRVAVSAQAEWCSARYRSYRASDNSFQPYRGPRKQCWSAHS